MSTPDDTNYPDAELERQRNNEDARIFAEYLERLNQQQEQK